MIKLINISKFYPPNTHALRNVSFSVEAGEFVSLVGQSGAGKTTVIKLLIAEEKATQGKIIIGGWDITDINSQEIPYLRRQVGVVFQDFKLLPKKNVYENVAFALEVVGTPEKKIKAMVPQILRIVGVESKANRWPHQLSAGEAQRVAIARAIANKPKILIADEPTGNLDSINTRDIIDLLLKINKFGTTILLVSHNREIVNLLKRRVITLDHGMVIGDQIKGGRYVI
ncbi:MAG: cell division ATP-binding protein FtsE [Patescibacteria group bacterium]|nr:cell division ATP-binding protein FtsE [Patescibacteria group bacterium]MDD5121407.1 cell division ATP-binding protein FtsE [Patescibacteria group bacterium]MDD5221867.1 cell division ATP-binding protein FtsE [Patescibacteria group bacterium]MDD5395674.1 cell division ATP-binding protein FtsE [Patescibacteria group bacterium]